MSRVVDVRSEKNDDGSETVTKEYSDDSSTSNTYKDHNLERIQEHTPSGESYDREVIHGATGPSAGRRV